MSSPSLPPTLRLAADDDHVVVLIVRPLLLRTGLSRSAPSLATVSRQGSWADFEFNGEPDIELRRLSALRTISDIFPESPFRRPAHTPDVECLSSSQETSDSEDETAERMTRYQYYRRRAMRSRRFLQSPVTTDSEDSSSSESRSSFWEPELRSSEAPNPTGGQRSPYRIRRSGFYGTPPSSTPSLAQQTNERAPLIDLLSLSALNRFVFDLRGDFPFDIEDIDSEILALDDDVLHNPWLAFKDEMIAGLLDEDDADEQPVLVDFMPRKLSSVQEAEEDAVERNKRVRRSLPVCSSNMPRHPSRSKNVEVDVTSVPSTPRTPHPPVMIAPLITLEEARKKFAHADSLDIPASPRSYRTVPPESQSPARKRHSTRSMKDLMAQLRPRM